MENLFDPSVANALVDRIERLTPASEAAWGSMVVAQMLAHCCMPFETVYDPAYARKHPQPNAVKRMLIRLLVKPLIVGKRPYARNMRTAPEFVITGERDFEAEQTRLAEFVQRLQRDGADAFDGRESHSFGPLTTAEWSTLFHKHTDHHLTQFGV